VLKALADGETDPAALAVLGAREGGDSIVELFESRGQTLAFVLYASLLR
jgi:hypothetical protein